MKPKKIALVALAMFMGCSQAASEAGKRTFVLWDPGLQLPAVCYRLDEGWQGKGTIAGRNAGFELWRQGQAETAAAMDRVRKARSEQIRDVVTVENPFEPGTKVERPAFFKNSWINSRQETMLLSDSSLEPNTIRGLMEQGEWLPAKAD